MKKFFCGFLILLFCVGLFPVTFFACGKKSEQIEEVKEEISEEDVVSLSLFSFVSSTIQNESGYSVFRYKGNLSEVVIPSTFKNKPVNAVSPNAFSEKNNLQSVVVPDSVRFIGREAFFQCINLVSVQLSNNLTEINESTFENCVSLESIVIPDSVESIGVEAFYQCVNLASVHLPNSLTKIQRSTFENCILLESIVIPDSVIEIELDAFNACLNLKTVLMGDSVQIVGGLLCDDRFYGAFGLCASLETFDYGDSVVEYYADFGSCYNLRSIRFGSGISSIIKTCGGALHWSGKNNFDLRNQELFKDQASTSAIEKIILTTSVTSIASGFFNNILIDTIDNELGIYVFNKIVIEGNSVNEVLRVFELIAENTVSNQAVRENVSIVVVNEEIANNLSAANNELEGGGFSAIVVAD